MTPPTLSMTATVTGMVAFGLTVHVPGSGSFIGASYTAKTMDIAISNTSLTVPCLTVIDPIGESGQWSTLTFAGKNPDFSFKQWHVLTFAAVAGTAKYAYASDDVRAWADEYFKALALLPFFTADTAPCISFPANPSHEYAQFKWTDNKLYHAVLFRHNLRLLL